MTQVPEGLSITGLQGDPATAIQTLLRQADAVLKQIGHEVNRTSLWAPLTDIRRYGAATDGSTNDNAAIQAAIAAGAKRIFLPKNTLWIPPSNLIPGGLEFVGEDWNTVTIESDSPTANYLSCANNTILRNVRLHHAFGYVSVPPTSQDKYSPLRFYQNTSGATRTLAIYPNMFMAIDTSGTDQGNNDRPGVGVTTFGAGDAAFLQTIGDGPALRLWHKGNNDCVTLERFVSKIGLGIITSNSAASASIDLAISTQHKTGGEFINLYHQVSTYAGSALLMNLGDNGGSFTGRFMRLMKAGSVLLDILNTGELQTAADIRLANTKSLLGLNAAGTATKILAQLDGNDNIKMEFANQTTVGATGSASALPAQPLGYLIMNLTGVGNVAVPYYNP